MGKSLLRTGAIILLLLGLSRTAFSQGVVVDFSTFPAASSWPVNTQFDVLIRVTANGQPLDTAAAYLGFDQTKFQVVSVTLDPNNLFQFDDDNSFNNSLGQFNCLASTPSSFPSGTFTLCIVRFLAGASTVSNSPLTFNITFPRKTLGAKAGVDYTRTITNGLMSITVANTPTPTAAGPIRRGKNIIVVRGVDPTISPTPSHTPGGPSATPTGPTVTPTPTVFNPYAHSCYIGNNLGGGDTTTQTINLGDFVSTPNIIIVKSMQQRPAAIRISAMAGGRSYSTYETSTDMITAIAPNSFTVGKHPYVNKAGEKYCFFAFVNHNGFGTYAISSAAYTSASGGPQGQQDVVSGAMVTMPSYWVPSSAWIQVRFPNERIAQANILFDKTSAKQPGPACCGDEDLNGLVSLVELVKCNQMTLGTLQSDEYSYCDCNNDQILDNGDITKILQNSNAQVCSTPAPSPTPESTPLPNFASWLPTGANADGLAYRSMPPRYVVPQGELNTASIVNSYYAISFLTASQELFDANIATNSPQFFIPSGIFSGWYTGNGLRNRRIKVSPDCHRPPGFIVLTGNDGYGTRFRGDSAAFGRTFFIGPLGADNGHIAGSGVYPNGIRFFEVGLNANRPGVNYYWNALCQSNRANITPAATNTPLAPSTPKPTPTRTFTPRFTFTPTRTGTPTRTPTITPTQPPQRAVVFFSGMKMGSMKFSGISPYKPGQQ